jgi:hypothetical protein
MAAKAGPCVLFLPGVDSWRKIVPQSAWYTLTSIIESWHSNVSVLLLATAHHTHRDLDAEVLFYQSVIFIALIICLLKINSLFLLENIIECSPPSAAMRREFFSPLIIEDSLKLPVFKPSKKTV